MRQNAGYKIIGSMRFPNPLDSKLETVLGVNEFGACVVWTYNAEHNGYSNGQYFTADDAVMNRAKAYEYFKIQVEYRLNNWIASANCVRSADASGMAEWAEVLAGLDDEIKVYEGDEWGEGNGGRQREYFTTLRLLTQVACCVRAGGWCSRTEAKATFGRMATVDEAVSLFNSKVWEKLNAADKAKLTPTAEDDVKATEAIAWAAGLDATIGSDYLWNIRVLALKEYIGYREAGMAGSIIAAYNRHLEREMARKYERDMPSEWFGEVGKREVFVLTVMSLRELNGDYGLTTLVMFRDAAGNRAKWFCSGSCGFKVDSTVTVKATIKAHDDYKGCKQTQLSRVVEYDAIEEARLKANAKVIKKVLKKRGLECKHGSQWFTFRVPELDEMSSTGEWSQPCCRECSEVWAGGVEVAA